MEINETKIYKHLQEKNNTFYCEHINKVAAEVKDVLSRVPAIFSNYTNHDIGHSARVADYMVDLLPQPINEYNDTELVVMLYSAIFHDIGMAVSETENELNILNQENIRKMHHVKSEDFINKYSNIDSFKIDNKSCIDFKKLIALIARSHGEDYSWIGKNLSENECLGNDSVNPRFISFLLRLGDYLDFDSKRTPMCLFDFLKLSSNSSVEWQKHFCITNYSKIDKQKNQIYFAGKCEEPDVFIGISDYFISIESEIKNAKRLLSKDIEKYRLSISSQISNQITHKSFDSVDLQFSMDYLAVSNLLMGENLYADKKCALRELIQNSLDAVLLKKEIYKNENSGYEPLIKITYSDNEVAVQDNGIGMTDSEIKDYFLNIGHSFYRSNDFKNLSVSYKSISHYGIGFLSSFLLSDSMTVKTASYKNPNICNILLLRKNRRIVIQKEEEKKLPNSGTTIIFERANFEKVFQTSEEICKYISRIFKNAGVKILVSEDGKETCIRFEEENTKNRIDVSQYMNNVECSFNVISASTLKNNAALRNIFPVDFPFELSGEYVYDAEYFPEIIADFEDLANWSGNMGEHYTINRLLDSNENLKILKIYPLDCDESESFNQAQEILDDNYGAFEYLQKNYSVYEPIRIYIQDESIFWDFADFDIMDMDSEINGYDETSDFKRILRKFVENIEKEEGYDVYECLIRTNNQPVFISNDLFSRITENRDISNYQHNDLFVKNVRVPYFDIKIPVLLKGLVTANFEINVFSENCYPDVTRSRMDNEPCRQLGYAIGRAIHIFILKNAVLKDDDKKFMEAFINKFYNYNSKNEFCKEIDL